MQENTLFNELSMLRQQGYTHLYVPLGGIGDALLFEPISRKICNQTKKKVLVSHKANVLFLHNPHIHTHAGFYDSLFGTEKIDILKKIGMELVYPCYWNYRFKQDFGHVLAYPKQHLTTEVAAKCGLTGEIDIVPHIYLTDEEKNFGNFRKYPLQKQIVVMSQAKDAVKQWKHWQKIVDHFATKHLVIQLGGKDDALLSNALDKRNLPLRHAAAILYNSDLFIGQVGGLMHMARAVNCPAVITYPCAEPFYFDAYEGNSYLFPNPSCNLCATNKVDYYYEGCPYEECFTKNISYQEVIKAAEEKLQDTATLPLHEIKPILPTLYRGGIEEYCLRMSCTDYKQKYTKKVIRIRLFRFIPFLKIIITFNSVTEQTDYLVLIFHCIPLKITIENKSGKLSGTLSHFIKLFNTKL